VAKKRKPAGKGPAPAGVVDRIRKLFGGRLSPEARGIIRREYARNPSGAFDRCVKAVTAAGRVNDPRAVCAASERRRGLMNAGRKNAGWPLQRLPGRHGAGKTEKQFWLKVKPTGYKNFFLSAGDRADYIRDFLRQYKKTDLKLWSKTVRRKRSNPEEAAAERYEYFHGHPPETVTDLEIPIKRHSTLSGVGKLIRLVIVSIDGKSEVTLSKFGGALLAQNEKGTQLFIEGGNQGVNLKDFGITEPHENEILGAITEVWYDTVKTHLQNGGDAIYHHKFGKKKTRLPMAFYDVRNKLLAFAGGEYDMPDVGIRG
jgi:hypothetical protein